jgi:3-hydroxyisobutyrate dehydrogenase-like beta-hydroxyacid dehydrogenase
MSEKPVVGFVGVGLMGWGMAKNAVEKGYPLRVVAHRKREAVDDLVARGARECASLAEMAAEAEIIVLCVTGSPEVEAAVGEIAPAARTGLVIVDSSTSEPDVTARLAGTLAERGVTLVDAPLSRTPKHTWDGEATTFVGGPAEVFERIRPLLSTWANAVIPVGGPVGTAHAVKLVNNLVALGYAAIWSECYATVEKLGVAPAVLHEVVSNSGMNCGNFQSFSKYAVEGDPTAHRFTLANGYKDLAYYSRLSDRLGTASLMSDAALQTLKLGLAMGFGERYVPEMVDIVRALNDPPRG